MTTRTLTIQRYDTGPIIHIALAALAGALLWLAFH